MALIMIAIFFVAAIKIFVWLNGRIVSQQVDYERTRVAAGSSAHQTVSVQPRDDATTAQLSMGEVYSDTAYPPLNIIK